MDCYTVTNCLLLTGTPLVASNVGTPWTRLVRGRHELDGDPVIADNGSGQVRPRCRATIQMTTNERRNEDLWQHDRILRLRNGRKKWLAPKNDPTRPPNGWSGRKETPHQGLKSLPSKRRPSCVRKSGKLDKKPSGFPWLMGIAPTPKTASENSGQLKEMR